MKSISKENYNFVKSVVPFPNDVTGFADLGGMGYIRQTKTLTGSDLSSVSTRTFPVDDFFLCVRPFLCFGKIIGLVPISGIFGGDLDNLKFRF
jgi:hypothetical protein